MKRKKYLIIQIFFVCSVAVSYGQSVPFLNSFSDGRAAAMGNAGYVLSTPFSVHHNAAAIMSVSEPVTGIAASCLLWQPEATNTNILNMAGYTKHGNLGYMGGIRYHRFGNIDKTDEQGNSIGSFSPVEYALELGLACKFNSDISAGIALRHISSQMDEDKKASSVAADISMLYFHDNITIGAGLSNLGGKIDYGNAKYDLPARIKTGIAYRFPIEGKHTLIGVTDAAYQLTRNYNGIAGGMGVEYSYDRLIALRTGYHFEGESVGSSYATIGCGVHLYGFSLDLAYMAAQNNVPMRQTMIISLKWER